MKPKNVLLITADQWRGECLSMLDHPTVKTPHLDALASDGVLFENHYSQCSPCGPSRASLYTGMYLQNHRSVGNGVPLDARHSNIALEMRKLGYDSTLAGYTDTTPDPRYLHPDDPTLKTYEGILPGFDRVLAMPSPSESCPEPWALWLEERGYKVPEDPHDLYYETVKDYPEAEDRGKTYAPARYSAEESDTAFITDKSLQFIRRPGRKPWFLHISYLRPHPPYLAPEPYNRMYSPDQVPDFVIAPSLEDEAKQHPFLALLLALGMKQGKYSDIQYPRDEKSMRQLRATYYGLMTEIDDNIGRIVALLKETGQYEDTVIVFTSDHGEQLGDHHLIGKGSYFDHDFHIPLIIRIPGEEMMNRHASRVEAFTENVDILSTILDYLDADIPAQCNGSSLMPFLRGERPEKWRTEAYSEVDFRYLGLHPDVLTQKELGIGFDECSLNIIRDEHYKYVHFAALPPLFFDLKNDPGELNNLIDDPGYTDLILKYAQKLLSWRMNNDESTLTGMMAGPNGIIENPSSR